MSALGITTTVLATGLAEAYAKDEDPAAGGFDISAGMFGPNVSEWIKHVAARLEEMRVEAASRIVDDEELGKLRLGGCENHPDAIDMNCSGIRAEGRKAPLTPSQTWSVIQRQQAEIARLRAIFPKTMEALATGSFCSADCSLEFLEGIPKEVELTVKGLVKDLSTSREELAEIKHQFSFEHAMQLANEVFADDTVKKTP